MTEKQCQTCAFWAKCLQPFDHLGNCERLSYSANPVMSVTVIPSAGSDGDIDGYTVTTSATFGCSEYQEKTQ